MDTFTAQPLSKPRLERGAHPCLLLALALLTLGLAVPRPAAAQANGGTDKAYVNGYNAGYIAGQQDRQDQRTANAHKFKQYQEGLEGYTETYGTRADYRTSFQSGFEDGYSDGYANRPESIGPAPRPAPPASGEAVPNPPSYNTQPPSALPGATPDAVARANGYREGFNAGKYDIDRASPANAAGNAEYAQGDVGYDPSLGAQNEYEKHFREGFTQGYEDGYARRLYNSSIGGRLSDTPTPPPAPTTAPAPPPPAAPLAIPPGTIIHAILNNNLSTKTSKVGDTFTASVTVPVWIGQVQVIPAGSTISGALAKVEKAGKMKGGAQLQLQYNTIQVPGNGPMQIAATTAGVGSATGTTNNEGTVDGENPNGERKVGTDSAIGAGLGGIFGGMGGLMRGAIAGAVIGTAGVLTSKSKDIELRSGQSLTIKLDQPLQVQPSAAPQASAR